MSEAARRCLEDVLADLDRQGGLDADDVHRLVAAHQLEPDDTATLFQELLSRGVSLAEEDAYDEDEDEVSTVGALSNLLEQLKGHRLLSADDEVALGRRIASGQAAERAVEADPDKRIDLSPQIADGLSAKDSLVLANVRLVVSIAKRYHGQGLDPSDLVQEGMFGLIRAAEKFDYTLGYKFSTYATWWIRQSLTRGLANTGRLIRLPVHYLEVVRRVRIVAWQLERRLSRAPSLAELASELEMDPGKVQAALDHARVPISIQSLVGDGGSFEAFIAAHHSVEFEVLQELQKADIARAMSDLRWHLEVTKRGAGARGADMLERRYGLHDGRDWTLDEIGRSYGVTRERVRQILNNLLESTELRRLFDNLDPL